VLYRSTICLQYKPVNQTLSNVPCNIKNPKYLKRSDFFNDRPRPAEARESRGKQRRKTMHGLRMGLRRALK
jgi:hypothetical protein